LKTVTIQNPIDKEKEACSPSSFVKSGSKMAALSVKLVNISRVYSRDDI